MCVGQKAEALDTGTKQFEELEFCQLEQESSLDERKETQGSQLLQEKADYHCSMAKRRVSSATKTNRLRFMKGFETGVDGILIGLNAFQDKVAALEAQVKELGLQAVQECERIAGERTVMLHLLQKVSHHN